MEKFKELWKNPRYNALIKLGGWFIFFLLIVVLCSFSTNDPKNEKEDNVNKSEVVFIDIETVKNNLLMNNYEYKYTVSNLVEKSLVVYNGEISDGVDNGYYESKTEIYKYSCTLEKCYKVFTDHQEEYEMSYPLEYIMSVFELIKDTEPVVTEDVETKIYKYNIDVQGNIEEVEIVTSLTDIISINQTTQKETYEIILEK